MNRTEIGQYRVSTSSSQVSRVRLSGGSLTVILFCIARQSVGRGTLGGQLRIDAGLQIRGADTKRAAV
jgi:hypothetical protein